MRGQLSYNEKNSRVGTQIPLLSPLSHETQSKCTLWASLSSSTMGLKIHSSHGRCEGSIHLCTYQIFKKHWLYLPIYLYLPNTLYLSLCLSISLPSFIWCFRYGNKKTTQSWSSTSRSFQCRGEDRYWIGSMILTSNFIGIWKMSWRHFLEDKSGSRQEECSKWEHERQF